MRTALVTGGGSGIGRATALRFADEGYAVAVSGRRASALAETVALAGRQTIAIPGDLALEEDAERMGACDARGLRATGRAREQRGRDPPRRAPA